MAIIELFDGVNEFSMENIDKIQKFCSEKMQAGYSLVLNDIRGITNNKNIEQIVEVLVEIEPSLLIILTNKDNISADFVDTVQGWLNAYNKTIKIGITVEKKEDLLHYAPLFNISNKRIMLIIKIVNNRPPLKEAIEAITNFNLEKILFIDLDHTKNIEYNVLGTAIDSVTELRRKHLIVLQLGCGFPMCMFTKEQLGNLFISPLLNFYFFCVSKVIIYPDLTAKHCNLVEHNVNILEMENVIEAHFKLDELRMHDRIQNQKCIDTQCWQYTQLCGGGCLYYK